MKARLLSRRGFLGKGLLASAAVAATPLLGQAKPLTWLGGRTQPSAPPDAKEEYKTRILLVGAVHHPDVLSRVQKNLKDKAVIISPKDNCGNTLDVLRHMQEWIKTHDPDIVHITTGYEDLRSIYYGTYENMVPRSFYKRNLKQIFDRIFNLSDKAVPIWATVTPVNDDLVEKSKDKLRDWTYFSDDVEVYNKEAIKVCRKQQVKINDLYDAVNQAGGESLLAPNGYELNSKGINVVANTISATLESLL